MYVDYLVSNCGPYRELLYVPGRIRFPDGRTHFTIEQIFVSTQASVLNGRRNWGIPKQLADFDVGKCANGKEEFVDVSVGGRRVCALSFREAGNLPSVPLSTSWIPAYWRRLAQVYEGRQYYFEPAARGHVRPGRLLLSRSDGSRFPDFHPAEAALTVRIAEFRMTFPRATVI